MWRWSTVAPLVLLTVLAVLSGCGSETPAGHRPITVVLEPTPVPSPAPPTTEPTAEPSPGVPAPLARSALDPADLRGFTYPLKGACLPDSDRLLPNAPREYRNGVHEGVDWYGGASCVSVTRDQPVLAMYDGVVVRADLDYQDLTWELLADLQEQTARCGCSEPDVLDTYRGRQVWIDHGAGVVTRYAHLETIAPGIRTGKRIERGEVIGGVGESGTPESLSAPGTESHPHTEVRIGESFLGAGVSPLEVRNLYQRLFEPASDGG